MFRESNPSLAAFCVTRNEAELRLCGCTIRRCNAIANKPFPNSKFLSLATHGLDHHSPA